MRGSLHLPSLIGSGFPRSLSFAGRRLLHLNDNKNKRALSSSSLRDYGLLRQRGKREFKPQIPFLSTSSSQLCIRGFSSDEKISSVENNEKALAFFESLENLHPLSKQALEKAGWKQMTDIQAQTWDPILAGSDVIGRVSNFAKLRCDVI